MWVQFWLISQAKAKQSKGIRGSKKVCGGRGGGISSAPKDMQKVEAKPTRKRQIWLQIFFLLMYFFLI